MTVITQPVEAEHLHEAGAELLEEFCPIHPIGMFQLVSYTLIPQWLVQNVLTPRPGSGVHVVSRSPTSASQLGSMRSAQPNLMLKIRVLPELWLQQAIGEIQFYQLPLEAFQPRWSRFLS